MRRKKRGGDFHIYQKVVSGLLIFSMLFGITVRIPLYFFGGQASAESAEFYNLVSVVVDEDIYPSVKNALNTYARNVQSTLEKTRVVIIPTPSDAEAIDISSMLEALYFQGYKSISPVDFESKLVGSLFVGNIPLPLASDGGNYAKTVLPYVDFIEKGYVYNHETKNYERDSKSSKIEAEVWHGFVSPNTGDRDEDIQKINDYFTKNDSFYKGTLNFDADKGIINGDAESEPDADYKPFVFYYDQFRENAAVDLTKYKGYQAYQENLEDITYNKFSKELAEKVKGYMLGEQDAELSELIAKLDPSFDTGSVSGPSTEGVSDIATRYITKNSTKKFVEVFNEATIGEFRKYVNNGGRYSGTAGDVNTDLIPFLVTVLDLVSVQVVKNANSEIENKIDEVITSGLSRHIALPTEITIDPTCPTTYKNILYGQQATSITGALDCSIYRGSLDNEGTLVESSRAYNIMKMQADINKCQAKILPRNQNNLGKHSFGIWGGHSPLNLDTAKMQQGLFEMKNTPDPDLALVKLYDPAGSQKITDAAKIPSPLLCFQNNYIKEVENEWVEYFDVLGLGYRVCENRYTHPDFTAAGNLMCEEGRTSIKYDFQKKFDDVYKECTAGGYTVQLDGSVVGTCNNASAIYKYKKIPSLVKHVSPTPLDLKSQVKQMVTPALPIDKNRYADFIGANGSYQKLVYPHLFRITSSSLNPTIDEYKTLLKNALDQTSTKINTIATNTNPSTLTGKDKEIYDVLKSGDFPGVNTDLYNYIASKPTKIYTLDGEEKTISYLDTLTFALYWNSLTSPSAKYKFIFENYLSDEFGGNSFAFHLPRNQKAYEVAYIGAPGSAQSMYIKMDPNGKAAHPYADIVGKNTLLNGYLFGANVANSSVDADSEVFKCAPPDGVPIWQWIPAVVCRLKDMLPPKIKISDGACGINLLSDEELEELEACSGDANKNGINDCIEGRLLGGYIDLSSDASRYYYESPATVRATLFDRDDIPLTFDNNTKVRFRLVEIEVPREKDLPFDASNRKTVYDYTTETPETRALVSQYVNFTGADVTVIGGKADLIFTTKSKDANLYFEALVDVKDHRGQNVISLLSNELKVEIRGDRLFATAYKALGTGDDMELEVGESTLQVSEYANVYIVDENKNDVNALFPTIQGASASKEKLIFGISNFSKEGNVLPQEYPLEVKLYDGEILLEDIVLNSSDLTSYRSLFTLLRSGEYRLHITDNVGNVYEKEFFVTPDVAMRGEVKLGANIVEAGGAVTTNLVTLYDRFDNVANADAYTVDASISGSSLLFYENNEEEYSYQTFEGYKALRFLSKNTSGQNTVNFAVKDITGETLFSIPSTVTVVPKIEYSVSPLHTSVVVGGETYDFKVIVKDPSGNKFQTLNSRIYLSLDSSLGTPTAPYFEVKNGEAIVSMKTKKLAKRAVVLSLQLEGARTISTRTIDILPDRPVRTDLSLSKTKMEAATTETSVLRVELKDRYGNTVFNDNSSEIALELQDRFKGVVTADRNQNRVTEGVATFRFTATPTPGIAYFKTTVIPSLDANKFTIPGQNPFPKNLLTITSLKQDGKLTTLGKKFFEEVSTTLYRSRFGSESALISSPDYRALGAGTQAQLLALWRAQNGIVIMPVSENAGSVETYYFWNQSKVTGKKYNALYTTLVGSNYGDITQKDYLAGALLFDKDNRSLAVTSLLNNPNKYLDVVAISENGNVSVTPSSGDLTQNIEFSTNFDSTGRIKLGINNTSLSNYVGDVYFNLDASKTYLNTCDEQGTNFVGCEVSDDTTSLLLRSSDANYIAKYEGNKLTLVSNYSGDVFSINKSGQVTKNVNIYLEYESQSPEYPIFYIKTGERIIGTLGINFVGAKTVKTKDATVLNASLSTVKNSMVLHTVSGLYAYREIFDGKKTTNYIYYQDPFASSFSLDSFSQSDLGGYENFHTEGGLGWQGQNKIQLLYASGKSVGEATRSYQSFSLINLGDPVVAMKKVQKNLPGKATKRSFEQGIGDEVLDVSSTVAFKTFDYNNDNRKDIVTLSSDGYFTLLENKKAHEPFKNLGHLAYIVDMKGRTVMETGDFTGDGHDDIFFVNKDGDPFLLNNVGKDFTRYPLKANFALEGKIMQVKSFDMDNDGVDDLVTLDDAGQIHIFYGGGTSANPSFTKLLVGNGYGIQLSNAPRNEGGLLYFDTLYQLPSQGDNSELLESSEAYLDEIQDNIDGTDDSDAEFVYNTSFVDNIIFVELPYDLDPNEDGEIDLGESGEDEVDIGIQESEDALEDLIYSYDDYVDIGDYYSTTDYTTFVRSEFAQAQGIEVKKIYTDVNGGTLKTADKVKVEITLKNTSGAIKSDIVYVESVAQPFIRNTDVPIGVTSGLRISEAPADYEFMVDNFDLLPGGEVKITYELTTLPIKFGYILAGLFEKGEVGDDVWGDVIVKPNNKNCGSDMDIYRSIGVRSYEKGKTKVACENSVSDEKTKDDNKNGIPDYIEDLIGGSDEDIADYAQEELDNLLQDSDGDGLPNSEDDTPYYNDEDGLLSFQEDIAETVNEISGQLDFLIKGFSCGFGGGSCIATPLNWAPLAPGNDPVFMGMPIGDGLRVDEGIPVFSALTGFPIPVPCGPGCVMSVCAPTVWPMSPLMYTPPGSPLGGMAPGFPNPMACGGATPAAGGVLGVQGPMNYLRMFVTPTLTGGVGTAICFGAPAGVVGYSNPPGMHPIVPGGNCIVAAMPLLGCQDDGSDGSIAQNGPPINGDYGVINGNCSDGEQNTSLQTGDDPLFDTELVREYMNYKKTGVSSPTLKSRIKTALSTVASGRRYSGGAVFPREALINMQGGGADDMTLSVDIDTNALRSGNFQDVMKVQMKRVWPFPDFLMEWVARQLEEVVTKLTDLPTLFIILPDFSGIMDDRWGNFGQNLKNSLDSSKAKFDAKEQARNTQLASLESTVASLDCSTQQNIGRCNSLYSQISRLKRQTAVPEGIRQNLSGMSQAYQFLSNMPLVAIEPQVVAINIPWIDSATLTRTIYQWQMTLDQWRAEVDRAIQVRSLGATCNQSDAGAKAACQEENAAKQRIIVDAHKLISSLEKNIQILNEYKDFPKKLSELIGKKDERIAQILCNIESITYLLGGWIGKNGKRFQAWVELIVLIKAILKSWQVLIDIFTGYDQSCHKCKNERHDLMYFIFKLINMVIPKIPIIQFPKWPDIVLDLHNIRAGMIIFMPDFKFNMRPIILPNLPELRLPDIPNLTLKLPALPILPRFTLPTLPDLPTLPRVELPDLPPPPKIPKLFASLEIIADIAKLITKVMCILKSSPFVPEWRAGDQIAFITERSGYLSFDFLDIALPQFSYPFVDAIKVTTYVNLEFENEFVVEMVRNVLMPLNSFSANITNSMGWSIGTLDFTDQTPANIIVDPTKQTPAQTGYKSEDIIKELQANQEHTSKTVDTFVNNLVKIATSQIVAFAKEMEKQKDVEVGTAEFVQEVSKNLASKRMTSDPAMAPLHDIWAGVQKELAQADGSLTQELLKNHEEKYTLIHDILTTEQEANKKLQKEIENIGNTPKVTEISAGDDARYDAYNAKLDVFNDKALVALNKMVTPDDTLEKELQAEGDKILSRIQGGLTQFAESAAQAKVQPSSLQTSSVSQVSSVPAKHTAAPITSVPNPSIPMLNSSVSSSPLLAAAAGGGGGATGGTCTSDGKKYTYQGLYVVEEGVSYRLFHYLDEVTGNEETISFDYDNDGDEDIVYMMANKVYVKENLKKKDITKEFVNEAPLLIDSDDNTFYNGDIYYEAINGFKEGDVNDSFINVIFSAPKRNDISNFRLEFYEIVDKFTNLLGEDYLPEDLKKYIVDGIAGSRDIPFVEDNEQYSISRNLAHIENPGVLGGLTMHTQEMHNIREDIENNTLVNITSGTKVYAGGASVKLGYTTGDDDTVTYVTVARYHSVEFKNPVKINSISGDAYVSTDKKKVVSGQNIQDYAYLPLPFGTYIFIDETATYNESSHLDIRYYDDSVLSLDFREVKSYFLYDLGHKTSDTYLMRQELKNDFYYATVRAFKDNIESTVSQQILLSPQKEADEKSPEITLDSVIRIPVYQKKNFDFTEYIYEDLGVRSISDFFIDFDIDVDSDDDGNPTNDRTSTGMVINKSSTKITVDFGPYDTLFAKKIGVNAIDHNDNRGYAAVPFEVYAPIPKITTNEDAKITGHIDENLKKEPVNIYRYRGGILSKLLEEDGTQKVLTGTGGSYNFNSKTATGLVLTYNEAQAATIDEFTGKITLTNPALSLKITPSNGLGNDMIYPLIQILWNGQEIYYQYLTFSKDRQVMMTDDFASAQDIGMYFTFTGDEGGYNYYHIPLTAPINPGATVIYDIQQGRDVPLFMIFRDGRINTLSANYKLEYGSYGDTVVYRLMDVEKSREIGKLLMKVDGNFIIQ